MGWRSGQKLGLYSSAYMAKGEEVIHGHDEKNFPLTMLLAFYIQRIRVASIFRVVAAPRLVRSSYFLLVTQSLKYTRMALMVQLHFWVETPQGGRGRGCDSVVCLRLKARNNYVCMDTTPRFKYIRPTETYQFWIYVEDCV